MKKRLISLLAVPSLALGLIVGFTGCDTFSKSGGGKSGGAAAVLKELAEEVSSGHAQLNQTVATLTNLIKNPGTDLAGQYKAYSNQLDGLKKTAANAEKSAAELASKKSEYLAAWNADVAKIQDPDLRKKAVKRQATIAEEFEDLSKEYSDVKAKFNPVLTKLTDIRTALSADLTAAGVKSVSDLAEDSADDVKSLDKAFTKLIQHFHSLRDSLVPPAPPAA